VSVGSAIDLSKLPPPQVVEELDYEAILAAMKADFIARWPNFSADLESEPLIKLLEVAAYRELLVRQRVNEAARKVMLAFARGSDLDHLGALYGVERLLVDPGDPAASPPVPAQYELDDALRFRIQLAPEAMSVAGPDLAYVYHARSASADIKDVSVESPTPGDVVVTVLSGHGDGAPAAMEVIDSETVTLSGGAAVIHPIPGANAVRVKSADGSTVWAEGVDYLYDLVTARLSRIATGGIAANATLTVEHVTRGEVELVRDRLNNRQLRPLTDRVTVQGATIVDYQVAASIWITDGPEGELVRQAAVQAVTAYVAGRHRLGAHVTLSGLLAALHVEGVWKAEIISPTGDVEVTSAEAAWCTDIDVIVGGYGG